MAGSLEAFVTLATNDTYAVGALVLGQSLRDVGTTRQLAIMITVGVSQSMRESLSQVFDLVKEVNVLDSEDVTNLGLLARPDLGITFTKLHCWRLTQYSKAVFMDADTLVIQNIDDLFEREEFSAAPDPGWPDCFNSGVFVFRPSEQTYTDLMQFALTAGSFDGGDQGLLNLYFHDWATKDISKHLPFVYNTVSQAFYSYLPAFKRFGKDVRVVHFIGAAKPWHQSYNPTTGEVTGSEPEHKAEFLQRWWKLFVDSVQPILSARGDTLSEEVLQTISSGSQVFVPPTPLLPYVPPDISPTYTPPPSSSSSSGPSKPETSQHQNTEPRTSEPEPYHFEHRDSYTKLESFYAEPPMSNLESYQAPLDTVYMARDFEETWKPPTPPPLPLEENVNEQEEEEEEGKEQSAVKSEAAKKEEEEGGGSPKTKETEPTSTPIPASTQDPSKSLQGQGQEKGQGDECSDISEVFASIRISAQGTVVSVPAAEPGTDNDPARQYAWEQGQIDYLGVDKFENIQKRLDKAMTEPPPPEPEKKPTSPFALPPSSSS